MALGSLRYVTSHDTKPHLFCSRLTRKATIHRKYFVCGSNDPTLRKLSFMKLKYLTCFILASLITSCVGNNINLPKESALEGEHVFEYQCPGKPLDTVKHLGKNYNNAVSRHRQKGIPQSASCKVIKYLRYVEGSQDKYLELLRAENSVNEYYEAQNILDNEAVAEARKAAEALRRRLAIESSCEGYGFTKGDEQFSGCVKDISISIAAMEQKENLEGKMRSTIRSEGALTRSNQEQIAEENRRSARWNARLLATTQTQNTDRLIQNNNMNSNKTITCRTYGNRTTCN